MPIVNKSSAIWDLNVNIRSIASLSRIASVNHPIAVRFAGNSTAANVTLDTAVDRILVPCKDFVLLFRDKAMEGCNATALTSVGKAGYQAASLSILPDFRPVKVRLGAKRICLSGSEVDFNPEKTPEVKATDEEEETKEPVFVEPKQNEYIFLIDRSGSMYDTIKLAREALKLFLQSLTLGSTFQIVSYGSNFEFLFKGKRSVEYNEKTFQSAFDSVSEFEADFGGTEILNPLEAIFKLPKPKKDQETHILLLTDGAVHNTPEIV